MATIAVINRRLLYDIAVLILLALGLVMAWGTVRLSTAGDFVSFIASGEAARAGLDPHAVYPATSSSPTPQGVIYGPNINLPPTVLAYELLPPLDPMTAANAWRLATAAMFTLAVGLVWWAQPRGVTIPRLAWLFAGPFIWPTLWSAQLYGLLVLLAVAAWLLLERGHHVAAGVLIGLLACIKPQFALWPLLLLASGHRRAAFMSLATAAPILALPVAVHGPVIYLEWWADANQYAPTWIITNMGIAGPLSRAGLFWLLAPVMVGAASLAVLWAWRTAADVRQNSTVALALSLVLSPIAWTPYLLILLPVLLADRPWHPLTTIGAAFLAVPSFVLDLGYGSIPVGLVYPAGLLLLSAGCLDRRRSARTRPFAAPPP